MRKLILTSLFVCLSATFLFAQDPPPVVLKAPPAPDSSTRGAGDRRFYESVAGGFLVNFPGKPKVSVSKLATPFGEVDFTSTSLGTPNAFLGVNFLDFPSPMTDPAEIAIRFDAIRDSMLKKGTATLIDQSEVEYDKYPGRDIIIESGGMTTTLRSLIIEQRVFQLVVVTPGSTLKSAAAKRVHEKATTAFFGSFKVTKLPEPSRPSVKLPADFGVSLTETKLQSEFFRFSIDVPKGWKGYDQDDAQAFFDVGRDLVMSQATKNDRQLNLSLQRTRVLGLFMNGDGDDTAMLMIGAEETSIPTFLPLSMTMQFEKVSLEPTDVVTQKPTVTKIGGVDFGWIETEDKTDKRRTRLYVANRNGIAFLMTLNYKNPTLLREMLAAMETLKFDEQPLLIKKEGESGLE